MPNDLPRAHAHFRGSFLVALSVFTVGGCSSAASSSGAPGEDLGVSVSAVTATQAIANAEEWVAAKLLYCQSPNGADDSIDPSCSPVCMREKNALWDPYRSDCSGLVSWAWGLPAPGRTTAEFAPNEIDITAPIDATTLQPADAVCTDDTTSNDHHIMLFKAWTVAGKTATFIEEPGCSATPDYAHEFTSDVTINGTQITVAYNGMTFTAIRYAALGTSTGSSSGSSGAAAPACTVNGVAGTCIDTSVCATMPGYVSTPGFCPGPADEQCCTSTGSPPDDDAGAPSSSASSGVGGAVGSGGGHGGAAPSGSVSGRAPNASSGCSTGAAESSPLAASIALLGALALLRRRSAVTGKPASLS